MEKPINVYMCDHGIARKLREAFPQYATLFGDPKVNVFEGREWFMSLPGDDRELGPKYKGEKFDFIFMTAESLKKYYYHDYKLDLKTILQKYGKEGTKVIVFRCTACVNCNNFVRDSYRELVHEYASEYDNIVLKYFSEYLPV